MAFAPIPQGGYADQLFAKSMPMLGKAEAWSLGKWLAHSGMPRPCAAAYALSLLSLPNAKPLIAELCGSGECAEAPFESFGIGETSLFDDAERRMLADPECGDLGLFGKRLYAIRANRMGRSPTCIRLKGARLWSAERTASGSPKEGLAASIPNDARGMDAFEAMLDGRMGKRPGIPEWANGDSLSIACGEPSMLECRMSEIARARHGADTVSLADEWLAFFERVLGKWKAAACLLSILGMPKRECDAALRGWLSSKSPDFAFMHENSITDSCLFDDAEERLHSGWMPCNVSVIGMRLFRIRANKANIQIGDGLAFEARLWSSELEKANPMDPFEALFDAIPDNPEDMARFMETLRERREGRMGKWKTKNI